MSRRRRHGYRRNYRNNGILSLTRNEQLAFNIIFEIISALATIIKFIGKGIYKLVRFNIKTVKNLYALQKIGYSTDDIDNLLYSLSPRGFEVFVAELYKAHGYKTELTPPQQDYGRDVILKTDEGDIFIECKKYAKDNESLGREVAQKLLGSMQMFGAIKGIIITTGKFHKNAYEVERMVSNLELMDTTDIMVMLMELDTDVISRILLKAKNAA